MYGVTHRIEGHLNKSLLLSEGTNIHFRGYQNRMKFSLCVCVFCICRICGSVGFTIAIWENSCYSGSLLGLRSRLIDEWANGWHGFLKGGADLKQCHPFLNLIPWFKCLLCISYYNYWKSYNLVRYFKWEEELTHGGLEFTIE